VIRGRIHDTGVKPATDESGYPAGLHVSAALPGSTAGKESRQPTAMNVDHFTSYWCHYCVITCKNGSNKTGPAERLGSPSAAKHMLVHFSGHKFVPWLQNGELFPAFVAHKRIRQLRSVYTKLGLHAIWQPFGGIVSFLEGGFFHEKMPGINTGSYIPRQTYWLVKQLDDRIHHLQETKPHHFSNIFLLVAVNFDLWPWGPIYKISYDLSQDYRKVYRKIHSR